MTALLLWALLQDPLDVDDIEARQAAAAEAHRQGEGALPELRRRRSEATDPEVRARLAEAIARVEADVRRRAFGGGEEVDGLKARLVRVEDVQGSPAFRLEIMNVSAAPRPFVRPTILDRRLPEFSSSSSGAQAEFRICRIQGQGGSTFGGRHACGPRRTPRMESLRSGELHEGPVSVSEALTPGVYEATVRFYAMRLLPGATADLVTNVVRFEIKP